MNNATENDPRDIAATEVAGGARAGDDGCFHRALQGLPDSFPYRLDALRLLAYPHGKRSLCGDDKRNDKVAPDPPQTHARRADAPCA